MQEFGTMETAMRQKDMAWEVRDYLLFHPNAAVVNLGYLVIYNPRLMFPCYPPSIIKDMPDTPLLVTAGGLFHYFQEEKVFGLLHMMKDSGNIELVFDTVNKSGVKMLQKKYMKQMGYKDAQMFFFVDLADDLVCLCFYSETA